MIIIIYHIVHIIHPCQGFNAGLFDYLIATDDSDSKEREQTDGDNQGERKKSKKHKKRKSDSEFGVVRGIDFKNVHTVKIYYQIFFQQINLFGQYPDKL